MSQISFTKEQFPIVLQLLIEMNEAHAVARRIDSLKSALGIPLGTNFSVDSRRQRISWNGQVKPGFKDRAKGGGPHAAQ